MSIKFCDHLDGEQMAGCFALFVFLASRDCCVALPPGGMSLSAVCDCGISRYTHLLFSMSFLIFTAPTTK